MEAQKCEPISTLTNFSIHWDSLQVLFCVFMFYYFHTHIYILTNISKSHNLILARGVFVEAGPQQKPNSIIVLKEDSNKMTPENLCLS